MEAPTPTTKRTSITGIPRPGASRLPAPKTRSATQQVQVPQPQSCYPTPIIPIPTPKPQPVITSQPDLAPSTSAKSALGVPRLSKRASTSSLARPSSSVKIPAAPQSKPAPTRTTLCTAGSTRFGAKPSTGAPVSSRARSLTSRSSISSLRPAVNGDDDEHNDRLGALDSFRSASRQGARPGHRADALEDAIAESQEPVESASDVANVLVRKASRPSLSDRTIESLNSVPSTPKERRRSSFFNPGESPMAPPPRPGSGLSRNGGNDSRPGTSDGTCARSTSSPLKKVPASAQSVSRIGSRLPSIGSSASNRRSISGGLTNRLQGAKTTATAPSNFPLKQATVSATNGPATRPSPSVQSVKAARPIKSKPSLADAFQSPVKRPNAQKPSNAQNKAVTAPASDEPKRVISNSSAALREQIAAAKAAARKEKSAKHDSLQDISAPVNDADADIEMHANPFNAPRDEKHVLKTRIDAARTDGKLNIAGLDLKQIPEEVRQMYSSAAMEASKVNWAELVDLSKLFAASNKLEMLEDVDFPDLTPDELSADEHSEGNQFGGLELLDLHDNLLQNLPMGLRRLERLTVLNVANNKLDNNVLDVISQIKTLRELKLGHNNLSGNLPPSICELPALETLDLQANRLLSLPEALRDLVNLKVLNISNNQLTALPMEALQQLPLTELDASSNALIASLFPLGGPDGHPTLQFLNVSNNSLAALTFSGSLDLPRLINLDVTNNHLTGLPAVSGWNNLFTLAVGDNKVAELPEGFTTLMKLRNVSLTGNELRTLDPEIAKMEGLESLILSANPLRDKRFLSMSAYDIKQELKSRLEPDTEDIAPDEPTSPVTVIGDGEMTSSAWSVRGNGVLDLASRNLSDDLNTTLGSFLRSEEVREIRLQYNKITCVPPALWIGQDLRVLDLSHNVLCADYLSDELELPALQELNLSACKLSSLEPLTSQLVAPNLRELNISANRLSGSLPALRRSYPCLTTLFANDNKIKTISADSLRGIQTANLASNDIEHLPAELGLLWDQGLKNFEVGSNAFRVPNYQLLQKGTEALLRWLRDKLPANGDSMAFDDDDEID